MNYHAERVVVRCIIPHGSLGGTGNRIQVSVAHGLVHLICQTQGGEDIRNSGSPWMGDTCRIASCAVGIQVSLLQSLLVPLGLSTYTTAWKYLLASRLHTKVRPSEVPRR